MAHLAPPGDSRHTGTVGGETAVATSRQSRPTRCLRNGGTAMSFTPKWL
ncbi:hypothetical protein [Nostoc sp. ChiQUE01b]|nr:hypothetical protein [Nostoc sp. ChiQUE01b]